MIFATFQYGVMGGAAIWGVINGMYLLVGLPLTHKYLLSGEAGNWLRLDVLPPLVAALVLVGLGRVVLSSDQSAVLTFIAVGIIWLLATVGAAFSANQVRGSIRQLIHARL